jgi:hypothetical protein
MPIAWLLDKILTSRGGCLAVDKGLAITNRQNCLATVDATSRLALFMAGGNC